MARFWLDLWDPWRMEDQIFSGLSRVHTQNSPPLNLYYNDSTMVLTSEIPGVDPEKIDLSVKGDTLILEGERSPTELKNGETWHRRERGYGKIYRKVRLPYVVESNQVKARYEKGVLKVTLPRAEADKPRKIGVKTA